MMRGTGAPWTSEGLPSPTDPPYTTRGGREGRPESGHGQTMHLSASAKWTTAEWPQRTADQKRVLKGLALADLRMNGSERGGNENDCAPEPLAAERAERRPGRGHGCPRRGEAPPPRPVRRAAAVLTTPHRASWGEYGGIDRKPGATRDATARGPTAPARRAGSHRRHGPRCRRIRGFPFVPVE